MSNQVWYWATTFDEGAAGTRFIIACGQDNLWSRARDEFGTDRGVHWNRINSPGANPTLADLLELSIHTVPMYGVDHNTFVAEAAQIPVFAKFLHAGKADLCNYVSNPIVGGMVVQRQPYSNAEKNRLGRIVSSTLNIESDWF